MASRGVAGGEVSTRVARAGSLRALAARGTIVTSVFLVAVAALTLVRGFVVARFVTPEQYGVWGVLVIALGTLLWLRQVGIGDRFVAQDEPDEELAFQKAFTLELLVAGAFTLLLLAALPVVALVYGRTDVLAPGLVLITVVPALALQAPVWVAWRRLQYVRQRALQSIDPVVGLVVSVGLAVAGAGTWALVLGVVAGAWAQALVAVALSPHPLRLRYDRGTARRYAAFSWPLLAASGAGIVVAQGSMLATEDALGIAAAGAVTLAGTVSQFADRVDQAVTGALYPAVCAVRDRVDVLHESFVKSNRLALMWAMPFGAGLALFAPALIDVLGEDRWGPATTLVGAFGLLAAVNHLGFNWDAYFRAREETRPLAVGAAAMTAAFLAGIPFVWILDDLDGVVVALAATTAAGLAVRAVYLRRLFAGFALGRHALRAVAPVVPAVALTLALRAAGVPDGALLAVYAAMVAAATWWLERDLLREATGYLRTR
ncbi:MAG: oligosaccharide flippase family protein [Solirubrobacterales bacterium]|nr:oligosaccharide flippase family protein [Solirubrobacterales bacterium]